MSAIDWIKSHPFMTAGIVGAVIIGAMVLSGGGSDTVVTSGASGDDFAAGVALQQIQAEAGVASQQINAELAATELAANTSIELAKIAQQTAYDTNQMSLAFNLAEINADQQTTSLLATLEKEVQSESIAAEVESDRLMAQTYQQQAQFQYMTTEAVLKNNLAIVKEQTKPKGLFSFIFG